MNSGMAEFRRVAHVIEVGMNSLAQEKIRRPSIIWLAIGYLFVSLVGNLLVLESNLDYFLRFDAASVAALLINVVVCILAVATFVAIINRAKIGRKLSIITFAILGFFSIYGAVTLLGINSPKSYMVAVIVLLFKLVIAMLIIGYMAFSRAAKTYFLNADYSSENLADS